MAHRTFVPTAGVQTAPTSLLQAGEQFVACALDSQHSDLELARAMLACCFMAARYASEESWKKASADLRGHLVDEDRHTGIAPSLVNNLFSACNNWRKLPGAEKRRIATAIESGRPVAGGKKGAAKPMGFTAARTLISDAVPEHLRSARGAHRRGAGKASKTSVKAAPEMQAASVKEALGRLQVALDWTLDTFPLRAGSDAETIRAFATVKQFIAKQAIKAA